MHGIALPQHIQDSDLYFTIKFDGDEKSGLVVRRFTMNEATSEVFSLEVEMASRRKDIDLQAILDRPALLTIHDRYSSTKRHFHGVVASISSGDTGHKYSRYKCVIKPSLHRLEFVKDWRIFQAMSIIDIAKLVFQEHNIADVQFHAAYKHVVREFVLMPGESYLAFLERLFSDEGFHYYFEHLENKHIVHISDVSAGAQKCPHAEVLEYNARPGGDTKDAYIQSFYWNETVRSTVASKRDHSFKSPRALLQHSGRPDEANGQVQKLEAYAFPGRYKAEDVGRDYTSYEIHSLRSDASCGEGRGRCPHLAPGYRFELKEHDNPRLNQEYFVVSVQHKGVQMPAEEEAAPIEQGTLLDTGFNVVRRMTPWCPARHEKPLIQGPMLAIVTGPPGEEIYIDDFGRVKVWFPFDRHAKAMDDRTSCWIRVASNWAGTMFGHIAHPRIGQHVLVSFVSQDADQPIITGRYYNGVNLPPNKLPEFKTRMIIQSKTHKGNGFNELRFEDEKEQEEVWLHAERYHNVVVKSDETWRIGGNRHKLVEGSQSENIKGNKDIQVDGTHTEVIGGVMNLKVDSVRRTQIAGPDHLIVESDQTDVITGNWTRKVKRNIRMESEAHQQYAAPGTIFLDGGDKVVLRAGSVISLNVGGNFIRIDNNGIQIEGTIVTINTGGGAPAKGKDVPFIEPQEPQEYQGPYAERYARSFKK